MARVRRTAKKRVIRRRIAPIPSRPYGLRIRHGEHISSYVRCLKMCIESYRLNDLLHENDFHTPERQAHILISTLPTEGPLGEVERKYANIVVNGVPNYARYSYNGQWFLTLHFLENAMVDAVKSWDYNRIPSSDGSDFEDSESSEDEMQHDPPQPNPENEANGEEDPEEEDLEEEDPEEEDPEEEA